ncbi:MAG: hypothetical protein MJ201_03505 [Mycoplasmoidaceae bacterium]|nr:hypothetical protein [Mycoplasmoidaceae bacterium]
MGFDNSGLSLLYVIFATLFAFITLSFLCEIILFVIGLIPNNTKYSKNDFIETPQALKYADIQKQFLEDHKNNPNYDLSVLN